MNSEPQTIIYKGKSFTTHCVKAANKLRKAKAFTYTVPRRAEALLAEAVELNEAYERDMVARAFSCR